MDRRVKERLIGASILVALVVLVVPELLSGPQPAAPAPLVQVAPEATRNVTVDLATSKAPAASDSNTDGSQGSVASSSAPAAAAPIASTNTLNSPTSSATTANSSAANPGTANAATSNVATSSPSTANAATGNPATASAATASSAP